MAAQTVKRLPLSILAFAALAGVLPAQDPIAASDQAGRAAAFAPGAPLWAFTERFDRNVLSPVYPATAIYDSRSRHLKVHTPTIEVGQNNALLVAIRDIPAVNSGVPGDMDPVNAIHFTTSADAGKTWSPIHRFAVGYAINPTFIRTSGPDMWLFYNAKNSEVQDDNAVWFCKSSDNFQTWTKPQPIDVGYRVHLIAHNGIQLQNGDLLLGFDYDRGNNSAQPFAYSKVDRAAAALISTDHGNTWHRHGEIEVPNYSSVPNLKSWPVEQVPVQTQDGRILMFLRTRSGRIYQAVSRDNGRQWSDAVPTPLSNDDSKVACIALPNGHLVLTWNDCRVMDGDKRYPLMASVSLDAGRTWAYTVTLSDDGVPAQYPALTFLDGRLKIIYAYNGLEVRMIDVPEADLHSRWTAINNRGSWRVADGLLRASRGPAVKSKADWAHWSKAAAFVAAKPRQFTFEADLRFDGPIAPDAALGVFSSYQDEDNWMAVVWSGEGKLGLERQEHFGWTSRPQAFRASNKAWTEIRKPQSDKWYHVKLTQLASSNQMVITEKETGEIISANEVETVYDGNFIAVGVMDCAASFANIALREVAARSVKTALE